MSRRPARAGIRLAGGVSALIIASSPVRAHVVYVSDEDERGDALAFLRDAFTDPIVVGSLASVAIVLGILLIAYLYWQPARHDLRAARSVLDSYRDLLPWLLRLGFGLPLVGAGVSGEFFNPAVEPIVSTELMRVIQIALGFALLFGLATRVSAFTVLSIYLISLPFEPALAYSPEWIPGLLAVVFLGAGRPSADQLLERVASADRTLYGRLDLVHRAAPPIRHVLAPGRRAVPTLLRVGLGITFIGLGVGEKLLAPEMAADVVHQYQLQAVLPIPIDLWILGAGLAEVGIGLMLLLGAFTRFSAVVALAIFTLALFAIPDDPVLAHVGIFAMTSALLITGSGPWALDNRIGTSQNGHRTAVG